MNKIILCILVLSVAVASIGFVSAGDMDDVSITDSAFDGELLNIDESFSDSAYELSADSFVSNLTDDSSFKNDSFDLAMNECTNGSNDVKTIQSDNQTLVIIDADADGFTSSAIFINYLPLN